ncbi:hypothetical protein RI367_002868 [Sorochytrium milnesiophthora]
MALRVHVSERKGRCFVAAQDIPKGSLVLSAAPYAAIADSGSRQERCARCLDFLHRQQSSSVIPCSACNLTFYCSTACQQVDYGQFHREECGPLPGLLSQAQVAAGSSHSDLDYVADLTRLVFRMLIRWRQEGGSTTYDPPFTRDDVDLLVGNDDQFAAESMKLFNQLATLLLTALASSSADAPPLPSHSAVVALICKEECNSFGLYDFRVSSQQERQGYGLALYPSAVFFNHSCVPNTGHVVRGGRLLFFTYTAVAVGEELCISYVGLGGALTASNAKARRQRLRQVFFFDCDCPCCRRLVSATHENGKTNAAAFTRHCSVDGCYGCLVPQSLSGDGDAAANHWKCEAFLCPLFNCIYIKSLQNLFHAKGDRLFVELSGIEIIYLDALVTWLQAFG